MKKNIERENNIPEINLKLETRTVESKIVYTPYILLTTPYMILSDKDGTRKVWIKDKKKIIFYYLYKFTRIKWFIKKYNE
jgi:hypothetical protein